MARSSGRSASGMTSNSACRGANVRVRDAELEADTPPVRCVLQWCFLSTSTGHFLFGSMTALNCLCSERERTAGDVITELGPLPSGSVPALLSEGFVCAATACAWSCTISMSTLELVQISTDQEGSRKRNVNVNST